jgi:hypothetical protein
MAIVPLPLPPDAEARALLHHVLERGDVVGRDSAGRTVIQLAVEGWVLDKLMGCDADAVELEDDSDAEPDADDEADGAPFMIPDVVLLDLARPKVIRRRRRLALVPGPVD